MTDDLVKRLRYDAKKLADDICGEAADRIEELEHIFAMRREAGTRAIKMWQDATPDYDYDLTWPDHADLCVWLMDKAKQDADRIGRLEKALRWASYRMLEEGCPRYMVDAARAALKGETE